MCNFDFFKLINMNEIIEKIEYFNQFDEIPKDKLSEFNDYVNSFLDLLNKGKIRAAEKNEAGKWIVNNWVKKGILLLFKFGRLMDYSPDVMYKYYDKSTLPLHYFTLNDRVRIVPGGTSIRSGSYIAPTVIIMPPAYVNIGAYIDSGTLIDSHALVGSCAQLGKNIHLSAASQIGGVLEPLNAIPVIIEDDVMIGGNCGVYEGVIVHKGAVLGTGVILNSSMKVYDVVNNRILQASDTSPLEIPENAVVISGSRGINTEFAIENKLSLYTPLIIKYKDDKTTSKITLNDLLRKEF
jgi:2,3,4,5-tetrahydropyridine-2-carboxylate N-succinyltransferase